MKSHLLFFVIASAAVFAGAQEEQERSPAPLERFTPEHILGSAENVRLVAEPTSILVEKISVSPKVTIKGWENGRVKTEESEYIVWDKRSPLKTEMGPLPVSDEMTARLKRLLTSAYTYRDDGIRMACGYLPCYRFRFAREGRSLDVLVIKCYDTFAVFQNGEPVGGRHSNGETHALVAELNAMFADVSPSPIQPAQPTRGKAPRG